MRTRTWKKAVWCTIAGSVSMASGCSPEAIRALIIGLDAAAGQIERENGDVSFSDWLDSEFDDAFED